MKRKTLRNDLILIFSILALAIGGLLTVLLTRKKENLFAKIYVKSELVRTVDLSSSDKQYSIKGTQGTVKVVLKNHSIGVVESNCPHQDCVHTGFIKETNRPIICAYNEIYIVIEGDSTYDARIDA